MSLLISVAPASADQPSLLARGQGSKTKIWVGTKTTVAGVDYFKPCRDPQFKILQDDKVVTPTTESCDFVNGISGFANDGTIDKVRVQRASLTNVRARHLLNQVNFISH
jgi:hypothetical protein